MPWTPIKNARYARRGVSATENIEGFRRADLDITSFTRSSRGAQALQAREVVIGERCQIRVLTESYSEYVKHLGRQGTLEKLRLGYADTNGNKAMLPDVEAIGGGTIELNDRESTGTVSLFELRFAVCANSETVTLATALAEIADPQS